MKIPFKVLTFISMLNVKENYRIKTILLLYYLLIVNTFILGLNFIWKVHHDAKVCEMVTPKAVVWLKIAQMIFKKNNSLYLWNWDNIYFNFCCNWSTCKQILKICWSTQIVRIFLLCRFLYQIKISLVIAFMSYDFVCR